MSCKKNLFTFQVLKTKAKQEKERINSRMREREKKKDRNNKWKRFLGERICFPGSAFCMLHAWEEKEKKRKYKTNSFWLICIYLYVYIYPKISPFFPSLVSFYVPFFSPRVLTRREWAALFGDLSLVWQLAVRRWWTAPVSKGHSAGP